MSSTNLNFEVRIMSGGFGVKGAPISKITPDGLDDCFCGSIEDVEATMAKATKATVEQFYKENKPATPAKK